jgi:hypothetical protein
VLIGLFSIRGDDFGGQPVSDRKVLEIFTDYV